MADGHGSKPHETVALVGLAGLAGAAGVTWLAGATAIRLSGHHLPPHHQLAGLAALGPSERPGQGVGCPRRISNRLLDGHRRVHGGRPGSGVDRLVGPSLRPPATSDQAARSAGRAG